VILNRSSIRRFKTAPISDKILRLIIEAGQRAPSACSLQTYSFILVKDPIKRRKIEELCGQHFISKAPLWIVVCADMNRLERTINVIGHDNTLEHDSCVKDKVYSIFDAALASQNMVLAAESLGLGSVFIGILGRAEDISKILKLPSRVLPIVLLCIGEPDERPPRRPRWPLNVVTHEDEYRGVSDDAIETYLEKAGRDLQKERYYLKYFNRDCSHTEHIKYKTKHSSEKDLWNRSLQKFIETIGFSI
jgi:nitroreductase